MITAQSIITNWIKSEYVTISTSPFLSSGGWHIAPSTPWLNILLSMYHSSGRTSRSLFYLGRFSSGRTRTNPHLVVSGVFVLQEELRRRKLPGAKWPSVTKPKWSWLPPIGAGFSNLEIPGCGRSGQACAVNLTGPKGIFPRGFRLLGRMLFVFFLVLWYLCKFINTFSRFVLTIII